ncbi:hypothetical protein FQR65_LT13865 [Abscondita terminalis]|nr:hypothetical protein FQR65_LT13865 [Abscondita terminalis]
MSEYTPASPRKDYLYYVKDYCHPTTAPERQNRRYVPGAYKYRTPFQYIQRPTPSTFNQVLYCNPQFTTDSSQATIPYEYESDLRNYPMQCRSIPFQTKLPFQPIKPRHVPLTQSYVKRPVAPIKKPCTTYPTKGCYRYVPSEPYPIPKQTENQIYSETEETESETVEEESDVESVHSKYEPILQKKPPVNTSTVAYTFKNAGDDKQPPRSNMEKLINAYVQNKFGRKPPQSDLETLIRRLKKEPIVDSRYVFKKSRCLESTYEKAAHLLKSAKMKAESVQNVSGDGSLLCNSKTPYDEYFRKQYSHLLSDVLPDVSSKVPTRPLPKSKIEQTNSHLIKKQEIKESAFIRCSPIPEEQSSEAKTTTKTPDAEQPVKLQKENTEPIKCASNSLYHSQSEKTYLASKDKRSIQHKSRRNPRRKRHSVGIYVCAKALKKFTEDSQITIQKHSSSFPTRPPLMNVSEQETKSNSEKGNKHSKKDEEDDPPSPKSNVTIHVNNMISKLDEIESLINTKKPTPNKLDTSTSRLTMNVDEGTITSVQNSVTETIFDESKESKKKKCPHCKESHSELSKKDKNVRKMLDADISTKSTIRSVSTKLLSNSKSSKYDSTDADVLQSIFKLQHGDADTSQSLDESIPRDSSSTMKKKTKYKRAFDSASTSQKHNQPEYSTTHKKSIVTVFPPSKRVVSGSSDSSRKKISRIPKLKRPVKNDDSSSDNNAYAVRPKYRGKKRQSSVNSKHEESPVANTSAFNSLRSAFCIIVDFLFRYFRNMFIL